MSFLHYNRGLQPRARSLRNSSTTSEIRLWCELLRRRQMLGYTFLRQRPVDIFIADFMCKELMLIIEVDGSINSDPATIENDLKREQRLRDLGFTIMRFTNDQVQFEIEGVGEAIKRTIREIEERDEVRLTQLKKDRSDLLMRHSRSRLRRSVDK